MKSRKKFEEWLNKSECPEHEHPINDGRVPWGMEKIYGTWLRKNDPVMFEKMFRDWEDY